MPNLLMLLIRKNRFFDFFLTFLIGKNVFNEAYSLSSFFDRDNIQRERDMF